MSFLKSFLWLLLALAFSSCQMLQEKSGKASLSQDFETKDFESLGYEQTFRRLLQTANEKNLGEVSKKLQWAFFSKTSLKNFYKTHFLKRQFDAQLDDKLKLCESKLDTDDDYDEICDMMQTDVYKSLQVYKYLHDTKMEKALYTYMRAFELSHLNQPDFQVFLKHSVADSMQYKTAEAQMKTKVSKAGALVKSFEQLIKKKLSRSASDLDYALFLDFLERKNRRLSKYRPGGDFKLFDSEHKSFSEHLKSNASAENFLVSMLDYEEERFESLYMSFYGLLPRQEALFSENKKVKKVSYGHDFKRGHWALTYNAEFDPLNFENLIHILGEQSASFFVSEEGLDAVTNQSFLKTLKRKKQFDVGALVKSLSLDLESEIDFTSSQQILNSALKNQYSQGTNLYRLPYAFDIWDEVKVSGAFRAVSWAVDSLDWLDKNPISIHKRLQKQMLLRKRGTIVFHTTNLYTSEVTRMLLDHDFNSNKGLSLTSLHKALRLKKRALKKRDLASLKPLSQPYRVEVKSQNLNLRSSLDLKTKSAVCGSAKKGERLLVHQTVQKFGRDVAYLVSPIGKEVQGCDLDQHLFISASPALTQKLD